MKYLLLLLSISCAQANADVYLHGTSFHFKHNDISNNKNIGVGVQINSWEIGAYRNSLFKNSVYIMYQQKLLSRKYVEVGMQYGAASSYILKNQYIPIPVIAGYVIVNDTLRIMLIPDRTLPALGFSIKW